MNCSTERLHLRQFTHDDAQFIIQLLNQKSFIDNIADKGVRTVDDAIDYLDKGPMDSYQKFGFGLAMVTLKTGEPIGMCGLLKRPELEEADIGYSLIDKFAGKGYASEAAQAVLQQAFQQYDLKKIAAVTSPNNASSIGLLEKLGFHFVKRIELYEQPVNYYLLEND